LHAEQSKKIIFPVLNWKNDFFEAFADEQTEI